MINKLVANIKKTGAPIVVGLDPMLNYIPEHVQKKAFAEFGETLEGAAEAIWQFNKEIVDRLDSGSKTTDRYVRAVWNSGIRSIQKDSRLL